MMHRHTRRIGLLMGPTGAGKSAMAMAIAERRPTVIINADAMQLVATLRVITARPTVEEEGRAEHALYGVLPATSPTSVAVWLAWVKPVIERAWAEEKLPLLVGGTGMYVKALMDGLAALPEIPEEVRRRVRGYANEAAAQKPSPLAGEGGAHAVGGRGGVDAVLEPHHPLTPTLSREGRGSLHARLAAVDPIMAARLKPGDTQRLIRALEVIEATGESLAYWQEQPTTPLFPEAQYERYYLEVPREELYTRLNQRFLGMMEQGALAEVQQLLTLNLPADTPILRAHGVPEFAAYLRGTMPLDDAIAQAQQNTRNYAKRQMTWIRNQMVGAVAIHSVPQMLTYV